MRHQTIGVVCVLDELDPGHILLVVEFVQMLD
jgi:hypothetical protein